MHARIRTCPRGLPLRSPQKTMGSGPKSSSYLYLSMKPSTWCRCCFFEGIAFCKKICVLRCCWLGGLLSCNISRLYMIDTCIFRSATTTTKTRLLDLAQADAGGVGVVREEEVRVHHQHLLQHGMHNRRGVCVNGER